MTASNSGTLTPVAPRTYLRMPSGPLASPTRSPSQARRLVLQLLDGTCFFLFIASSLVLSFVVQIAFQNFEQFRRASCEQQLDSVDEFCSRAHRRRAICIGTVCPHCFFLSAPAVTVVHGARPQRQMMIMMTSPLSPAIKLQPSRPQTCDRYSRAPPGAISSPKGPAHTILFLDNHQLSQPRASRVRTTRCAPTTSYSPTVD